MKPRHGAAIIAGILLFTSCSAWRPLHTTPGAAPQLDPANPVRAIPVRGRAVVLYQPQIVGDSLIGNTVVGELGTPVVRSALALREVERLEVVRPNRWRAPGAPMSRSAVGTALGVVVFGGLLFLIALTAGCT